MKSISKNIKSFNEVLLFTKEAPVIRGLTKVAGFNTKIYMNAWSYPIPEINDADYINTMSDYENNTNLECKDGEIISVVVDKAKQYKEIAVLIAVNNKVPGDMVEEGHESQECKFCRCSNLYSCLSFLKENNQLYNRESISKNIMLATKEATLVRRETEDDCYDLDDWYNVNIMSYVIQDEEIYKKDKYEITKHLRERIRMFFNIAYRNKNEVVIFSRESLGFPLISEEIITNALNSVLDTGYKNLFKEVIYLKR